MIFIVRRPFACVALLLAGCAPATAPRAGAPLPAYADGTEFHVPTSRGVMSRADAATTGTTHYFQVNTRRVCYAFHVPGTWETGRETATLRRVDGKAIVGVLLLGVRELGGSSAEDAIRKAAERSGQVYAKERGATSWTLTPYPRVPGAWQWTLPVSGTGGGSPGAAVAIPPRWYLPVGDAWIAQFTVGTPPDVERDAFVAALLESLTTSREPRCYEARLRELGGVR